MTRLEEIAERDDDPIGPQYVKPLIFHTSQSSAAPVSAGWRRLFVMR